MNKNRTIHLRVTKEQYLRIQNRKEAEGYLQLSNFIRSVLLEEDIYTRFMVRKIYEKICQNEQ
jgi:hypothetical protein